MYKILLRELNKHITVDFAELCRIKNIKPKLGIQRWQFKRLQADRISAKYPSRYETAQMFGFYDLPDVDADEQPSSWIATKTYIERMYGLEYAKGFERADYPKLKKAA